ncbi:uncharacterized protein LOC130995415 [Salvia miltiorrhiza]|uniref:uncharacterized protein LOC130995415 n=1 Tax=Salvia miltiorrhiza TaxID=226208 RepID=UPI0025AD8AB5|nr:uncharacterized protein LOC130995415 [Salvia miltiorrhiza]
MMSDAVLLIDDDYRCCRICHEHDFQILESPCHCSGTLKFAHRDCIQRWCDEKGNTTCEICLQKFKPGYTAPAKKLHTAATISLFVAINEPEMESTEEILESDCTRCISAVEIRWLALVFTILLLAKNLLDIISGGSQGYPFSLVTVFIVRATGIIVPIYILFRITAAIHNSINNSVSQPIHSEV